MSLLRTLDDIDIQNKTVLLRLDLNMPLKKDPVSDISTIADTARLESSLKTLQTLQKQGAKTLIVTHIGRPQTDKDRQFLSTRILQPPLEKALQTSIVFATNIEEAKQSLHAASMGTFILLENIRFWKEEEENDNNFALSLSTLCDVYVNEAFSVSHRKHASVYGVPQNMSVKVAGYNFKNEVDFLHNFFEQHNQESQKYTLCLVGGSKVSTKLRLLHSLLATSTIVILGGGMANTFLIARGDLKPGSSFYEKDFVEEARHLLQQYPLKLMLPIDGVVADTIQNPDYIGTFDICNVPSKYQVFDIGPKTIQMIRDKCAMADTILWNGPMGVFEHPPFDKGSGETANALVNATQKGAITLAGGGETLACLGDDKKNLSFVSTAGGAFLEYLENGSLPGVGILSVD